MHASIYQYKHWVEKFVNRKFESYVSVVLATLMRKIKKLSDFTL